MHKWEIRQSDDDDIGLMGKIVDPHNERNHFLIELLSRIRLMTLEHTTTITTNVDQLPNKAF